MQTWTHRNQIFHASKLELSHDQRQPSMASQDLVRAWTFRKAPMASSVCLTPPSPYCSVTLCIFPCLCASISLRCSSVSLIYLFHVSQISSSIARLSVFFCLLCVTLSLLSDPPHAMAKPLLGTGSFLSSSFAWDVAWREIVIGLSREQSRGRTEVRVRGHQLPSSSHVMGTLVPTSPASHVKAGPVEGGLTASC